MLLLPSILFSVATFALAATAHTFDYIIVGGGLSGLVVASRLSEITNATVLVIEYGPIDRSNRTQVPYFPSFFTDDMFSISSAPEPFLGNTSFPLLIGAVLGGGSVVNGMALGRASAADYDAWEMLGNPGWGWEGLFPYFKKATTFMPPTADQVDRLRYTWDPAAYGGGPLKVGFPDWQYPDQYTFFKAFDQLGVPWQREHALGNATMLIWEPNSLDASNMTRSSAVTAYLDSVSDRTNLNVLTEHQVTDILFSSDLTAEGVKVVDRQSGEELTFYATKEVVLAAGAVHTPQLLQVSGIGPKSVLESAGVVVKYDLPAVGSNFQDHPAVFVNFTLNGTFPGAYDLSSNATFNQEALEQYLANRTGPYTESSANSIAFFPLNTITDQASTMVTELTQQTAQSYLPPIYASKVQLLKGFEAQRSILASQITSGSVASIEYPFAGSGFGPKVLQKPLSRGTIHLNTTNPYDSPIVTHHALQNPFDRHQLYAGIQYIRKFFNSSALSVMHPIVENVPGAEAKTEDEVFEAVIGVGALRPTFAHPSGTCAMMPEDMGGCVGADLLVYGTKRLSVVDTSVMPIIPACHLQASVYAVAEKAADIIKSRTEPEKQICV